MRQWETQRPSVEAELATATKNARVRRTEERVEYFCRHRADFNNCHAPAEHIPLDDAAGSLATACAAIGLDLAEIDRRVRAKMGCAA